MTGHYSEAPMLTRIHGKIQFECDDCSDVLDTEESDFSDALRAMRNEGWHSEKEADDWSHYCPRCK